MPITVKNKGNWSKTKVYLVKASHVVNINDIERIAEDTVIRLQAASPYQSIRDGWSYEIQNEKKRITITFYNSCVKDGANIALLVDSGYATSSGTWVAGKHYIDEPIQHAYEEIMKHTWEALRSL